jgi:hypothetical protein
LKWLIPRISECGKGAKAMTNKIEYGNAFDFRIVPSKKRLCEINEYVPTVRCTKPATTGWGHGSIIVVCDEHAVWNPIMMEGGKCPNCGRLADHRICKNPSEKKAVARMK